MDTAHGVRRLSVDDAESPVGGTSRIGGTSRTDGRQGKPDSAEGRNMRNHEQNQEY